MREDGVGKGNTKMIKKKKKHNSNNHQCQQKLFERKEIIQTAQLGRLSDYLMLDHVIILLTLPQLYDETLGYSSVSGVLIILLKYECILMT